MRKTLATILASLLLVPLSLAQTGGFVHYGEADGLTHRHVTQMLQDGDGFIWLATWNGLCRFDGREFVTFKSRPGDGIDMPSDRFRTIAIDDGDPHILNCRIDDRWFRFSLLTGKFSPVTKGQEQRLSHHAGHGNGKSISIGKDKFFSLVDRQGLTWRTADDGIVLYIPQPYPARIEHFDGHAAVKAISADSIGRIWIASKEDKTIRIYDHGTVFYLSPDGSLSRTPVAFGSPIYCIYQSPQTGWDVWLGSKPDGLFHLKRKGAGFEVTHIRRGMGGMPSGAVYDIKLDALNRLWLATMDAGLVCLDKGRYTTIRFGRENKARHVYVVDRNTVVATTTEGFLVVDCTPGKKFRWCLHQREPNREQSLSNNACMDFIAVNGNWFVSTESGGINEVVNRDDSLRTVAQSNRLSFKHYNQESGLGSDIILSMALCRLTDGSTGILAVSNNSLIIFNPATGESREFSGQYFHEQLPFSDALPLYSPDDNGSWFIGLNDGLAIIGNGMFADGGRELPIVLTSIAIENRQPDYMVNRLDEITLNPDERTIAVAFAVLDYRNPKNIRYAYRIHGDRDWHYLGNGNTVRLSELAPGDYELEMRATNATGKWNPKVRTLRIVVEPKFTETVWFQLIILLIIGSLVFAALWTRGYIRRIKANQKETLEAYLALLEKMETAKTAVSSAKLSTKLSAEDEAFMSRVVAFVEANISDSEVSVDDIASAAAVSRSSLNRKMKSIVGVTPADFLREARVKHACALLTTTNASVTDIAYRSGFTDPKYFSRVFRQTTGKSPSEYRTEGTDEQKKQTFI